MLQIHIVEIHLYISISVVFNKWKEFLRITFWLWWNRRLHKGVKYIFASLTWLLSCFLVFWPVRVQFCSFEFVLSSLSFTNLPFRLTSYPWLAKFWGGHSTLDMPFLYINMFAEFCPQVFNRCFYGIGGGKHEHCIFSIWLETFKIYFFPHENFLT